MANPIIQQINRELETLQNELTQFKSTVEYLDGAKDNVTKAVQSVNHARAHFNKKVEELKTTYDSFIELSDKVKKLVLKIDTINFPERLDKIESTVIDTISILEETKKETLEELKKASEIITQADFEGRFNKLQKTIDDSAKSNAELGNSIRKLKLNEKIKNLEKKIDDSKGNLRITVKKVTGEILRKIDNLLLPDRLDNIESGISRTNVTIQKIDEKFSYLTTKLDKSIDKQISVIKSLQKQALKKQLRNTYISWALIGLGIILILIIN
jgi:predicted  nucleic acid-binding Zn-ribbon protein